MIKREDNKWMFNFSGDLIIWSINNEVSIKPRIWVGYRPRVLIIRVAKLTTVRLT